MYKNNVGARLRPCPNNSGITLIALIITIIVMLILVAVTISMAVNGGLFNYAGKAVSDTQNAIKAEQQLADGKIKIGDKWYASIDDYIAGKVLVELPEGIKVGDYVNYEPTAGTYRVPKGTNGTGSVSDQGFSTDSNLKWRILSIDEKTGEIEIVSETSVHSLQLIGANGYNHVVDILNDMCEELYSKENTKGERVATGRSINVDDINDKTTYDYTEYTSSLTGFTYGHTKRLSEYRTEKIQYPNLYSQEKGYGIGDGTGDKEKVSFNITGIGESKGTEDGVTDETSGITTYSTVTGLTNGNTAGTDPYITDTYYNYEPESCLKDLGINTAQKGLLKTGTDYLLASRCVMDSGTAAYFAVRSVNSDGKVDITILFMSFGNSQNPSIAIRPVVTLGSKVTLTKDTENSTETKTIWNVE